MAGFADFDPDATGYHGHNALALGRASALAYRDADQVVENLDRWGFTESRFFDVSGIQGYLASDDRLLLIAFRGTDFDLRDIITDINIELVPGPVGQVHRGFYHALDRVWPEIIDQFHGLYQGQPVWLCGHSLGAALATLAAARLIFDPADEVRFQGLYTYGSPRVGDEVFAVRFNERCQNRTFRFRNNNDVVTRVPVPGIFGLPYRHVGNLCYFDASGRLRFRMTWWEMLWDRIRGRLDDLGKPGSDGMKDHAMDTYLGKLQNNVNVTP